MSLDLDEEPDVVELQEAPQQGLRAMFGQKAPQGFKDAFAGLDFPVTDEDLIAGERAPKEEIPVDGASLTAGDVANTAPEREVYFDAVLANPNLNTGGVHGYDADVVSMRIGDTGNEQALYTLDGMADASGGELGKMAILERDVDQAYAARDGSLSKNLSEPGQLAHEASELKDMPEIGGPAVVMVTAAYEQLLHNGVNPNALDRAMGAGDGPEDYRAVLGEFHELAAGNPALQDYIAQADEALAYQEREKGVTDVRPPAERNDPVLKVDEPRYAYHIGMNGPLMSSPGFG